MSKNELPSGKPAALISDGKVVSLPVEPDHFRDFISGLLGRPQTIDRRIEGPYEIEKDEATNIHHLLRQRIERQNEGYLVSFSARIFYTDNSSVLLNSLDDFLVYSEIKPLISDGLHLSWIWLVRFQDRETPEKQEISVMFRTPNTTRMRSAISSDRIMPISNSRAHISIRVAHTDRSWGNDIDSLLEGHIRTLLIQSTPTHQFLQDHIGWSGTIFGAAIFIASSTAIYKFSVALSEKAFRAASRSWEGATLSGIDLLDRKLDYAIHYISSGPTNIFGFAPSLAYIMLFLISLGAGVGFSEVFCTPPSSHILLTRRSYDAKRMSKLSGKSAFRAFIVTSGVAIIIGVAGNFASTWLAKVWPL